MAPLADRHSLPVRLAVVAGVVANDGAVLVAEITYTPIGGTVPVSIARDSVVLATGGNDATFTLSANASGCLRDASTNGGASCTMSVSLILKRDGRTLDQANQQVPVAANTNHVDVPVAQLFEVATVRIAPTGIAGFEPGDVQTFTATALDRSGVAVSGRPASWELVNGGITVSQAGEVRAVAAGPAQIRARMGGRSAELAFVIAPASVARLDVAPLDTLVSVGTAAVLRVVARAANGDVLPGRTVTFTSGNLAVATVSATGVATGVAPGQSPITVRSTEGRGGASVTATATLRVELAPVIAVDAATLNFDTEIGQALPAAQTTAVRNTGGGSLGTLSIVGTNAELSASLDRSTAPATLSVQPTVALAGGVVLTRIVRLHSSTANVAEALVTVTLTGRITPVATVTITPPGANLVVGETVQLTAVLRGAAGNTLTGRVISWSTNAAGVATIGTTTGLVSAVGPGTATITATSEGKSATVQVTVTPAPVSTVSVSLGATTIGTFQFTQASATLRDANNNVLTGRTVTWSSSNPAIASVNASTGLVSGGAAGTANIIATSEGKTGSALVTVSSVPVATVAVSLTSSNVIVGLTTQATATLRDANSNVLTGRAVAWSSSNTAIATVNSVTGLVTTAAIGTVTIIAASEGRIGSATLTVVQIPVATVAVTLGQTTINVGNTTTASAVTRDANNNVLTGRVIAWSSSNTAIATVNVTTGLVSGVAAGNVNIIATSESRTGSASLTVANIIINSRVGGVDDSTSNGAPDSERPKPVKAVVRIPMREAAPGGTVKGLVLPPKLRPARRGD